jgi:hypothetical protein
VPAATPSETVVTRSSEVAIPVAELQTPYCHASSTGSFAPHTKGTGLDAAIAKAIADQNGFRLSIINRQDAAGAVAQVQIPIWSEGSRRLS